MEIVVDYPPLIDEIDEVFHVKDKPNIVYCWGDKIYNPSGGIILAHIIAHEEVHSERQHGDPTDWWINYLYNPEFRLHEEIPAHRAEYAKFKQEYKDRNMRTQYLHSIAIRLSGPLYKNMISYYLAHEYIKKS